MSEMSETTPGADRSSSSPDAHEPDVEGTRSRRTLMTSAVAAGAGVMAGMLVTTNPAGAADGDAVTVGGTFTGEHDDFDHDHRRRTEWPGGYRQQH